MHMPPLQYDCVSCGKSCTDFQVEITARDITRVDESASTQALEKEGFTPLRVTDNGVFIAKAADGRCCYLDGESLCALHREGGFAHKPTTCQTFPFAPVGTPDGVFLGLSFYCTAVARSSGRPLEGREAELGYLLALPECEEVAPDSQWRLWGSQAVDWGNYLQIEGFCRSGLGDHPRYGLLQTVWRLVMAITQADMGYLSRPLPIHQEEFEALQLFARKLIPVMESSDKEVSAEISRAINRDEGFESPALGKYVVLTSPPDNYPEWFEKELTRYLDHILFRKSLLKAPDVLSRLCLLVAAEELLATYAFSHAQLRGSELEPEDFYKAVGVVEGRLMLHANGLELAIQTWAECFVEMLQGLDRKSATVQ
ncbi:MAG: YkgJ family cysteine cluster protein [Candidatus Eremiobacteraeota bacterium]|nr:YkgJ family cysteine cluster protein [Candidatus Eremiobacteraeota bacterium]